MKQEPEAPARKYVTVCDHCLKASCWQGLFMCDHAVSAGTMDLDVEYLHVRALEHPSYWESDTVGPLDEYRGQ